MFAKTLTSGLLVVAIVASTVLAQAITIDTVPVGDQGNTPDTRYGSYGAVGYAYNIGTYEVTAGQYTAFLNAVAATDTYALYNANMWSNEYGCKIQQSGTSGSFTYSVASDYSNRPVNYVSWGDGARFANWLHNGQPTGLQDLSTTEDGAYYLDGEVSSLTAVKREADWKWAITNEDEWYKAAYYKGGSTDAGYWDYPTGSDNVPGRDMADVSGNNANVYGTSMPIDAGKYTTVVGEFQLSDGPYGTFDQGGNVWEWNESRLGSSRGMRGGAFDVEAKDLRASVRGASFATAQESSVGFRVVSVPEPRGVAMLLGIALTASLCWWTKHV